VSVAVVTGSGGLIGAEVAKVFAGRGLEIAGVDNDLRREFFGPEASTSWQTDLLQRTIHNYTHYYVDIRSTTSINSIFEQYGNNIAAVIHCAAQPSHDWAARDPVTDFAVNVNGTLILLEATRKYCPDAVFLFVSTNKVYGDRINALPMVELETRFELDPQHPWAGHGIDESMPIDDCLHSPFGASKLGADILVQEYGRYFGVKSACFRCGCLTGAGHSPAALHGFLAYLVKCAVTDTPYTIFGYKGKQVRDNLHARDVVEALWCFLSHPGLGEVFNLGGGRQSNCSVIEAIAAVERLTNRPMRFSYEATHRIGDHIWWLSDARKFKSLYPDWQVTLGVEGILEDIYVAASALHPA
jgi:CDP-paratose 2-epimerase